MAIFQVQKINIDRFNWYEDCQTVKFSSHTAFEKQQVATDSKHSCSMHKHDHNL